MNRRFARSFFRRLPALLCSLTFLLSSLPAMGAAAPSEEEVAQIFKKRKTTGGMVLAAKDGSPVFSYCYGFANKYTKEKITEEHYFKLASVSKLVTAVCAMRLVDEGRLDLDADIGGIIELIRMAGVLILNSSMISEDYFTRTYEAFCAAGVNEYLRVRR
jgi:CubicO group peptidase (beta-lactamase class C family)